MLLVPMFAQGELVSVLMFLNKHNLSGPFDSYVEKVAQHFAAKWGPRLASTLHEERMRTEFQKLYVTFRQLPSIVFTRSEEECMVKLGAYLADLFCAEACWVLMADRRGSFRVVLSEGAEATMLSAVDAGLCGETAERSKSIVVKTAEDDCRHNEWLETRANIKIRSVMCAPMFATSQDGQQNVFGVIQVMNKLGEVARFSENDVDQLEMLSPLATSLLENTKRVGEMATLQKDVEIAFERRNLIVSETGSLHQVGSTRGLLSRCRRLARSLLGAAHCNIFLVGYQRDSMFELQDDLREQSHNEEQRGIVGFVIKNGVPCLYDTDTTDPTLSSAFDKEVDQRGVTTVSSLLCVPLKDEEGATIGAWHLCNCYSSRGFRREDVALLQTIGSHLVLALRNEESLHKMLECNRRLRDVTALSSDPAERLRQLAQALPRVLSAERAHLFVRNGQARAPPPARRDVPLHERGRILGLALNRGCTLAVLCMLRILC